MNLTKRIVTFVLVFVLSLSLCLPVSADSYKPAIIQEIVESFTDSETGMSCRYISETDIIVLSLVLPISKALYEEMPVERVGSLYDGFRELGTNIRSVAVECGIPETTTVFYAVSKDNVPLAVVVNASDILRNW